MTQPLFKILMAPGLLRAADIEALPMVWAVVKLACERVGRKLRPAMSPTEEKLALYALVSTGLSETA